MTHNPSLEMDLYASGTDRFSRLTVMWRPTYREYYFIYIDFLILI